MWVLDLSRPSETILVNKRAYIINYSALETSSNNTSWCICNVGVLSNPFQQCRSSTLAEQRTIRKAKYQHNLSERGLQKKTALIFPKGFYECLFFVPWDSHDFAAKRTIPSSRPSKLERHNQAVYILEHQKRFNKLHLKHEFSSAIF